MDLFFKFPKANILHNKINAMIFFLFNRTISDFHPFWTVKLLRIGFVENLSEKISTFF